MVKAIVSISFFRPDNKKTQVFSGEWDRLEPVLAGLRNLARMLPGLPPMREEGVGICGFFCFTGN
jgi:hypothetical protein